MLYNNVLILSILWEACAITHKNSAIMHVQHTDIMRIFVPRIEWHADNADLADKREYYLIS